MARRHQSVYWNRARLRRHPWLIGAVKTVADMYALSILMSQFNDHTALENVSGVR